MLCNATKDEDPELFCKVQGVKGTGLDHSGFKFKKKSKVVNGESVQSTVYHFFMSMALSQKVRSSSLAVTPDLYTPVPPSPCLKV